jgi:alpha-D-xyloside xylohydrolase
MAATAAALALALPAGAGAAKLQEPKPVKKPPAANVKISKQRVIVRSGRSRAVINRTPFWISFFSGRRPALRELVANADPTPKALPVTEDPEPFALERDPDNALYAPLTYEVGNEIHEQWTGGLWTGNTLFSRRSGTTHAARGVKRARPHKEGVRMLVTTSEPGRRLVVKVVPDGVAGLRVTATPNPQRGVMTVGDSFATAPGEGFHGFGGTHGTTDKRGEKVFSDVAQQNLGGQETLLPGLALFPVLLAGGTSYSALELGGVPSPTELPGGFERYMFPNGMNAAYYPQAQFISDRGYGFLLNRDDRSRWRMANDRGDAWQVQASGGRLDYTVFPARGRRGAISHLTKLTGRHRLPPPWAQGPTLVRAIQIPALPGGAAVESPETYRNKIEQDIANIRAHGLNISAYSFEGWALLNDLDYVRSVTARLRAMGIRSILYVRAYMSDDALATEKKGDYAETKRLGLVATTPGGAPYEFGGNGGAPATLLDFTKPATVKWWRARLKLLVSLGADGFMQDFGEQVQDDMHFADGRTGLTMHNRYPVLFHKTSRRILDQIAAKRRREPIWFYTRSGYSGRPGSAAFEMGNFPGDETVDWGGASGLRSLAPDMLNRAVGGAFGYTTDIGGYLDNLTGPPSEELYNRWSEWSALTPYFRVHNSASSGTRMPWFYGAATLARWKALADLHTRAIPLLRKLWKKGRRTGMPVTRPMWLAAPEAPGFGRDQQWLLGHNLLVAPVVFPGATTRQVALPAGCWSHGPTGQAYTGPGSATVPAPLGALPHFTRCGTSPLAAPAKKKGKKGKKGRGKRGAKRGSPRL